LASVVDIASARIGEHALDRPVREVTRVVLQSGGQWTTATPMLWQTGVAAIDESHRAVGTAPDLDYYVVPGAVVAGGGALARSQGGYVHAANVLPGYIGHFIQHDLDSEYWDHPEGTTPLRAPVGISVIHNNLVFGHWLTEMFPKLLMLETLLPHLRAAPIILPSTAPGYVKAKIEAVLKGWPVLVYDRFSQHVEVDNLIMPSMFHNGYHFHPQLGALIDRHVAWARGSLGARVRTLANRKPAKLFISRRDVVSCFRDLTNFTDLERVASEEGFEIVRPQDLTWRRQVELFSRADCIVGEFGSGMHNSLFSPSGARVICLNWIVEVQSRIANFRQQSVGYLLPPDGEPRLFARDGRMIKYEIDPEHLRLALRGISTPGNEPVLTRAHA
jgi:O-antigen biosynthesis protein WbqL